MHGPASQQSSQSMKCFKLAASHTLTHFILGTYANSADPVQMPQNVVSELGLHCLLTGISMQNTVKVKIFTRILQMYKSK